MGNGVQCAVSDAGTLVYMPGSMGGMAAGQLNLVWVDRKGMEESIAVDPDYYIFPGISPDGTKVALRDTTGGNQGIWILDLVHKTKTRLTFDKFMAVPVKTVPIFSFETPKVLFQGTYVIPTSSFLGNWDIHSDGKRFLMVKPAEAVATEEKSRPKINIVLNWFEELKNRVPLE